MHLEIEEGVLICTPMKDGKPAGNGTGMPIQGGQVARLTYAPPDAEAERRARILHERQHGSTAGRAVTLGRTVRPPDVAPGGLLTAAERLESSSAASTYVAPALEKEIQARARLHELEKEGTGAHDLEAFRTFVQEERLRASGRGEAEGSLNLKESIAIGMRHFIHPKGYALAFEFMRMAAEAVGDTLTADGVWMHGARGELWLPKVLEQKGLVMPESSGPRWAYMGHTGQATLDPAAGHGAADGMGGTDYPDPVQALATDVRRDMGDAGVRRDVRALEEARAEPPAPGPVDGPAPATLSARQAQLDAMKAGNRGAAPPATPRPASPKAKPAAAGAKVKRKEKEEEKPGRWKGRAGPHRGRSQPRTSEVNTEDVEPDVERVGPGEAGTD